MAPTQRSAAVAIAQTNHFLHVKLVVSMIYGGENPVFPIDGMRHLGVEIIEIDAGVLQVVAQKRKHQPRIGGTPCRHHRGLMVVQRGFKHQAAGHQTHTALHPKTFRHFIFHRHVKHRRETASKVGGDVAFVKCGVLHRVVVEHGEEAQKMRGIVDGCAIQ